jgi:hypothetical protein
LSLAREGSTPSLDTKSLRKINQLVTIMKKVTFLFAVLTLIAIATSCGSGKSDFEAVSDSTQVESVQVVAVDSAAVVADTVAVDSVQ